MTKSIAKQKTVGKDFSVLKPEERIEMTAFAVFQLVHKGEKEQAFQPRANTLIRRIWETGRLSMRQQRAWHKFTSDFDNARGKSGPVTSGFGDYTDRSEDGFRVPTAYENAPRLRVNAICDRMTDREYALLKDLLQDYLKGTGNIRLELIGLMRSGYPDKNSARVAGVVHVQTLLDRVADFYQF